MDAEGPVEWLRGLSEVCEEGDGSGKGGKFRERDWRKAVVVECTTCTYGQSASV